MDGVLSDIHLFGATFAPLNWSYCNGATVSIAENQALYALMGTTFGGDGRITFGLPDLRGRTAVGTGSAPGLMPKMPGNMWGRETCTLSQSQMPAHNHFIVLRNGAPSSIGTKVKAHSGMGNQDNAGNGYWATSGTQSGPSSSLSPNSYSSSTDGTLMASDAVEIDMSSVANALETSTSGSNSYFEISQPSIAVNHIICMQGTFPSRN